MPEPDTTPAASLCHCGLGTREGCATEPWGCGPASTDPGTSGRTVTGATIAEPQVQGGGAGDGGADNDGLRERYAAAIRDWHRDWEKSAFLEAADAVLAVRDQEMQALRAEVQQQVDAKMGVAGEWGNALADKATAEATTARVQAELDRIASLPTVTVDDGHADRFSVGARWTLNLIRTALTPPAPGGQTEGAQP